jgi:hypothetical protein
MTDPIIPVTLEQEKADLPPQPVESLRTINPPMASSTQMIGYNGVSIRITTLQLTFFSQISNLLSTIQPLQTTFISG